MTDFSDIENSCGYVFKDKRLLQKALTLSSYDNDFNNESLECLGDALLTFIVAEKYYAKNLTEGEITAKKQELLSDEALRPVSERLGLAAALLRDKGDKSNKKAVPSAYEAFVAAVYLDGGLEEARKFALSTLTPVPNAINYIKEVQEILQSVHEEVPDYGRGKSLEGTPQKPLHKITVTVRGRVFRGEGDNFQAAKRCVAKAIYEFLTADKR